MDFALLEPDEDPSTSITTTTTTTTSSPSSPSSSSPPRDQKWLRRRHRKPFEAGDLVMVMEKHDNYTPVYLEPGAQFQNRLGHFHHDDMIGQVVGSRVYSRSGNGTRYIRLLLPSSELWTCSLRQRTQIVQDLDQSLVVFMLGLKPGAHMLESGTGSGAMSHAILRAISPNGHLHTFEFHKLRAEHAREDFGKNHLGHLVTVRHADICQELESLEQEGDVVQENGENKEREGEEGEEAGTTMMDVAKEQNENGGGEGSGSAAPAAPTAAAAPVVGTTNSSPAPLPPHLCLSTPAALTSFVREVKGQLDAVFFDVPKPWLAIPLASTVLKPNAPIATYSPCLEQVFKTCEALRQHNFHSIRTMEVRHKQFDVWRTPMPSMNFGDDDEEEEEEEGGAAAGGGGGPAGGAGDGNGDGGEGEKGGGGGGGGGGEAMEQQDQQRGQGGEEKEEEGQTGTGNGKQQGGGEGDKKRKRACVVEGEKMVAKPRSVMRGHTAFLTFAFSSLQPVVLPVTPAKEKEGGGEEGSNKKKEEEEGKGQEQEVVAVEEMAREA